MTVKDLYNLCKTQIENGNGYKEIILCVNENEFEVLENSFSSPVYNDNEIYDFLENYELEEDDVIVLN